MPASDEPVVTVNHLRRLGLCAKGSRDMAVKMFGRKRWKQFVLNGAPVSELEGVPHPDVKAAVALAKEDSRENK